MEFEIGFVVSLLLLCILVVVVLSLLKRRLVYSVTDDQCPILL